MGYATPFQHPNHSGQSQGGLSGGAAAPLTAGMQLDSRADSVGYKRLTPLLSLSRRRQSDSASQQQLTVQQQQDQLQMLSNTRRMSLGAPQPQPCWHLQQQLQQEPQQQQYQPHPPPLVPQQRQSFLQQQQQQISYGQQRSMGQHQQSFARQQQLQQQQHQQLMQQQQQLLQQQQHQQQLQQHQRSMQQRQSVLQPLTLRASLASQLQSVRSASEVQLPESGAPQQQRAPADNWLLLHNSASLTSAPPVLSHEAQSGLSVGAAQAAKLRESSGQPLRPTPLASMPQMVEKVAALTSEPPPAPPGAILAGLSRSRRQRGGAVAQRGAAPAPRPAAAPTEITQTEPRFDLDSEFEADYALQRRMSEVFNRAVEAPPPPQVTRQPVPAAEEENEDEGQEEPEKPFMPGESLLRWLAENVALMRSRGRLPS